MDVLQRRVVQEDMVQYKLFLIKPAALTSQQIEEHLTHFVEEILAKVAPLLIQYIWHHHPFNLKYFPEKGICPCSHWSIEDNDGEFLLIEAADYLPKWLNPDTSENRVFLYRGELHILPCPSKSCPVGASKDVVPSVAQALALLSNHPEACRANPKICSALRKRLEGYPEKIQTSLHRAHCFIPAGVATVLAQRPDLVAPAVSAFYLRDPVDLQACRSFKAFPPDTRVLTSVTFTRCLYAQLQQQQFTPDRRSGFTLPPRSHPQHKAHELGMKLAHGFEILCSKCRLPSSEPDAPVSCNPQWKSFINSLKRTGELEGSASYRELTKSAENFFKQSVASKSSASSPGEEVLQLLHSCTPFNLEELRKQESELPLEDSDSWMDITAQDLERMLQERSGGRAGVGSQKSSSTKQRQHVGAAEERRKETEDSREEEDEEAGYSLVAVSQGMKKFLNAMSSHEGAELPCSSTQPFSFDPDSMASALDNLLGSKEEELDSDDLDDEDDDEEEEEEEEEKEEGLSGHAETNGTETLDGLRSYMDQMDQELMGTNIGQSFNVTVKTLLHVAPPASAPEIQPLDVDLNLVTNLLESLSCQAGLAGPASNLLQSLGLHLPPNSDPS
uniref:Ecdysoneless homolog (Drosophila) n=1 Tax=Labrus bergylta TaxID=56723 RepID=A0A3Q3G063_9LABR